MSEPIVEAYKQMQNLHEAKVETADKWSIYAHKRAHVGDGKISWVETNNTASIIDIHAGKKTRGHHLVKWLAKHTGGKEMDAVGVVPEAEGFWDKMESEGHITGWNDENWVHHFGLGGHHR
jgi:hypothetical protein